MVMIGALTPRSFSRRKGFPAGRRRSAASGRPTSERRHGLLVALSSRGSSSLRPSPMCSPAVAPWQTACSWRRWEGPVAALLGLGGGAASSPPTQQHTSWTGPVALVQVLDHPALIITRPIEWGTVLLGFEQVCVPVWASMRDWGGRGVLTCTCTCSSAYWHMHMQLHVQLQPAAL